MDSGRFRTFFAAFELGRPTKGRTTAMGIARLVLASLMRLDCEKNHGEIMGKIAQNSRFFMFFQWFPVRFKEDLLEKNDGRPS